jgi:hypothetical protein
MPGLATNYRRSSRFPEACARGMAGGPAAGWPAGDAANGSFWVTL